MSSHFCSYPPIFHTTWYLYNQFLTLQIICKPRNLALGVLILARNQWVKLPYFRNYFLCFYQNLVNRSLAKIWQFQPFQMGFRPILTLLGCNFGVINNLECKKLVYKWSCVENWDNRNKNKNSYPFRIFLPIFVIFLVWRGVILALLRPNCWVNNNCGCLKLL